MTMPKFEPVAWLFKGFKPGYRTEFASIDSSESQTWPTDNGMVWNKGGLYTADQLSEAYEAGKREQAAQIEGLNEQVAELERAKEYKYVEQVLRPIKILIALAQSAKTLAENSEETENSSGKIALGMPSDFETLSENLDLLDELPDDKPGYTLSGAAKAAWALRDLLGENYD